MRIDRHRCRVDDPGGEGFARAVWTHAEDRDRHLLAARAAVGHVQVAVAVEHGVVHLVQSGREWRCDIEMRRVARTGDPHRGPSAFEPWWHDRAEAGTRCIDDARARVADPHFGQERPIDGKTFTVDADAAAFNRCLRMNGADARGHYVSSSSTFQYR